MANLALGVTVILPYWMIVTHWRGNKNKERERGRISATAEPRQ